MPRSMAAAVLLLALLATLPASGAAQEAAREATVVYLVRHAETAPDGTRDAPLSERGIERAEQLARMFGGAGLSAVYTTDYQRTRQTAGFVAGATGLTPVSYDPRDLRGLAGRLRETGGRILVVGHSNTTPALVGLLGGEPGAAIAESEYGRVYALTLAATGTRTVLFGYPEGVGGAAGGSAPPPASR